MRGRRFLKLLKWAGAVVALGAVLLAAPIAYVETLCTSAPRDQDFKPLISDPEWHRSEAATYLTYPEWHIVYAYEELAEILKDGDEHGFRYASSVAGFWSSYCALNRLAQEHGGGDFETRSMIYVIGTSFTLEMGFKGAYEHTLGRLAVALRGPEKTAQDRISAEMAERYALFLRQTPWYKFPFDAEARRLWSIPASGVRGWERRFALGLEWMAKQAYARLIAIAVEASGEAETEIHAVVSGLSPEDLQGAGDVRIVSRDGPTTVIQAPRYREFSDILHEIAIRGGKVMDIAGNDDVLASYIFPEGSDPEATGGGTVVANLPRQGFGDRRALVSLKVDRLADLFREIDMAHAHTLEHVYDY